MTLRAVYFTGLALLLNSSVALQAQSDSTQKAPNPTVTNMLRITLDFLATDKKAFGNIPKPICKPCTTYEELTAFAKTKRLKGADDLINDARREAKRILETNPTKLPGTLQTFLLNRVTSGNKSYRKQLPTFSTLRQNLNAIANGQSIQTAAVPATVDGAALDPADSLAETADALTDTDAINQSDTPTKPFSTMDSPSYLPIIALVLSILNLIGLAVLWNRSGNKSEPIRSNDTIEIQTLTQNVRNLKEQISHLTNKYNELRRSNQASLNTPQQQPPVQTQQTQNRPQPVPNLVPTPEPVAPVVQAQPQAPPVVPVSPTLPASTPNTFRQAPAAAPTILYGRTADLGDGFSISGLSNKPDRDTVFEIRRQTDTQALFQVSDQPELQRLALSDPYSYLNDTCSYQTQPRPGSRIRTEKPGKLSLQGDKWAIVDKAQISFIS